MTQMTLLNRYKEDSIITAPRERLILMLYDCATKNLNQALLCLDRNDRARFGLHLGKAQSIISELLSSLDHKVGGEIAKNLEKLYLFVIDRLMQANLDRQGKGVRDSIRILQTLKEGWDHAVRQAG